MNLFAFGVPLLNLSAPNYRAHHNAPFSTKMAMFVAPQKCIEL
jgi:hypothetical protein